MNWKLMDAKNRLSEVVNLALSQGPQRITRRGDAVVVLSEAEYERLAGINKQESLIDFLSDAGASLEGLDISRDKTPMREVLF